MGDNGLGRHYPLLAERLPCITLGEWPTPLDDAAGLARALGLESLHVKRDDRSSPFYGGNKVRKLEYLLADALERGCDTAVTYGSVGSNHALATATFATRLGLDMHAGLVDQPASAVVTKKLRLLLRLGARVHHIANFAQSRQVCERLRESHPGGAGRVADIPWGGSNWLGATGFVAAAFELLGQLDTAPDYIYVSGGTMGTATGLTLGLRAAGTATRLVAPRAVPAGGGDGGRTLQVLEDTSRELHARDSSFPQFSDPEALLESRPEFYGTGYAVPTPASTEALELARRELGIRLEDTYTAKAFAGLIADARSGRLAGKRVVFWHTYSSAPYPEDLDSVDTAALPESLRHYLETPAT
ncbi:MAG: pyridoxal-phosphate dependent enzyme [Gammaproteobacteria bacterium]|nr:pyridoxal-phosphate dependent enzyme [Gammaproteobacteria bacterium]